MGKSCDPDLQFVCFEYYSFHFNIVVHCHGDFNLIPSENEKNMKIINVNSIHYRGHNCALLAGSQVCWESLLRQKVRLGPVNLV